MDDNDQDLIADIVYNKLYSHKEIEKLADYIGEDIWSQHYIYLEDFLMCFAVAWTTERFMQIEYGGVYHRYGNPQGMTSGVYEMDGKKLKNPQYTNKRLGDLLSMWEKIFDLTENELDGEYFRVKLIVSLKHFKGINLRVLIIMKELLIYVKECIIGNMLRTMGKILQKNLH